MPADEPPATARKVEAKGERRCGGSALAVLIDAVDDVGDVRRHSRVVRAATR